MGGGESPSSVGAAPNGEDPIASLELLLDRPGKPPADDADLPGPGVGGVRMHVKDLLPGGVEIMRHRDHRAEEPVPSQVCASISGDTMKQLVPARGAQAQRVAPLVGIAPFLMPPIQVEAVRLIPSVGHGGLEQKTRRTGTL
jgi:hypothetical protein